MSTIRFRAALVPFVLALIGLGGSAHAQLLRVTGYASASTLTSQQGVYQTDFQPIGDAYHYYSTPSFEASANALVQYDLAPGDLASRQTAAGSIYAYAQVGGLRGAASGSAQSGERYTNDTGGGARVEESWSDVVTFHTANPLGADFVFSLTLDYSMQTLLYPAFIRNTDSGAQVISYLFFDGGGDPLLQVYDSEDEYIPDAAVNPGTRPLHASNATPTNTVTAVVHVFDGQVATLSQSLLVQAGVGGNGLASADASDTAYFNLYSTDPTASYRTASGTVFATSGDPFGTVAAVPEPSEWALLAAGLCVVTGIARRRRRGG